MAGERKERRPATQTPNQKNTDWVCVRVFNDSLGFSVDWGVVVVRLVVVPLPPQRRVLCLFKSIDQHYT